MRIIFWLTVVLAIGFYICGPIQDPDLWWHIVSGRWMLAHGSIPHQDLWNMFGKGNPWRAYSWSNEILFAWFDGHFGILGLLTLKLVLSVCIAASLCYCFGRLAKDYFFGAVLGIYCTAACFNHFTLRPQSFVWIFFVWLLYVCEQVRSQGLQKNSIAKIIFIMMLWANTHLSSAFGIFCIVTWLWGSVSKKTLATTVIVALIGTLITPYVGGEWITFFSKTSHPLNFRAIAEFQPATILQYSTGFLVIILALALSFAHLSPRSFRVGSLVGALIFVAGSLTVVKFLPFAVIYLCAVIASSWESRQNFGGLAEGFQRLKTLVLKLPLEGLSFLVLCSSIVMVYRTWNYPLELAVVPKEALDFIIKRELPKPLLNTFGQGGYVMYRFSNPDGTLDHPVSIDGRTNVTPSQIWEKYLAAQLGKKNWKEYLDAVKPETILWRLDSPLVAILEAGGQWCSVYSQPGRTDNEGAIVFVKRSYFESHKTELTSENCS